MISQSDARLRFGNSPFFPRLAPATCIWWKSHWLIALLNVAYVNISLLLWFWFDLDRGPAWKLATSDVVPSPNIAIFATLNWKAALIQRHRVDIFLYSSDCFRDFLYVDVLHPRWWHHFVQDCQEPHWWYVWQACSCPWQPVSQSCPGIPHSC